MSANVQEREAEEKLKRRVDQVTNSKFRQQTLWEWRPQATPMKNMISFSLLGLVLLGMGFFIKNMSDANSEYVNAYVTKCNKVKAAILKKNSKAVEFPCTVEFTIDKDLKAPVYLQYELSEFYQNHRRYVKSRQDSQLKGNYLPIDKLVDCDPVIKVADLWDYQKQNMQEPKQALKNDDPAIPCGLMAKSIFNDTYILKDPAGKQVTINDKNIAWETDVKFKFKNTKKDALPDGKKTWKDVQWLDMTDPHFIVWMRTSGLPNFRKLWGVIETDLAKGKYSMEIQHNYNTDPFKGEKKFVLATTNALGGKNYILANCHIALGAICLLFALINLYEYKQLPQLARRD